MCKILKMKHENDKPIHKLQCLLSEKQDDRFSDALFSIDNKLPHHRNKGLKGEETFHVT